MSSKNDTKSKNKLCVMRKMTNNIKMISLYDEYCDRKIVETQSLVL